MMLMLMLLILIVRLMLILLIPKRICNPKLGPTQITDLLHWVIGGFALVCRMAVPWSLVMR